MCDPCRNNDGAKIPDAMGIVSGIVTAVEIPVTVRNVGDDAFGPRISVKFNTLAFSRAVRQGEVRY